MSSSSDVDRVNEEGAEDEGREDEEMAEVTIAALVQGKE